MAKIHYVWWGNPPTDDAELTAKARDTPNQVARMVGDTAEVHYWRQAGRFNPDLNPRITVHEVDDPYDIISGTNAGHGNGIRMKNILNTMSSYRMYAAVKDLLSLAIVLKEGGFFFDTTTKVTDRWKVQFFNALRKPPPGPRVPYYPLGDGAAGKTMKPGDHSVDYTMSYPIGVPPGANTVNVPNFDVWALYGPPGDKLFETALNSYLDRAQKAGLDRHPASQVTFGSSTVHQIMTTPEKKDVKNFLIAGLSTTSIAEGLYARAQGNPNHVTNFGWKVVKKSGATQAMYFQDDVGAVFVPDLGVHKVFGGSWR